MFATIVIDVLTVLLLPWLLLAARLRRRTGNGSPKANLAKGGRRRILVIQLGKIGDVVCTTPLLRALRTWDAAAEITMLGIGRTADVLAGNTCADRFIDAQDPAFKGVAGRVRLLLFLYRARFTVSIAVLPGTWNAVLGLWTAAPVRLHTRGGRMGLFGSFLHFFHTHRISYARGTRTYDHYMNIARALGISVVPYRHEIFLSVEERAAADRWLQERGIGAGDRFAVLSLTAGNRLKEWPLERFVEVAKHLAMQRNMRVLFSTSDRAVTSRACALFPSSLVVDAGGLSLRLLSAVIARAALFVSVDTGPLYIAHAFDVPLVDIVGPVDPGEQPPPPGERAALVLPPGIAPSSFVAETLRVSVEDQRRAIEETTVAMVIEAIEKVLP